MRVAAIARYRVDRLDMFGAQLEQESVSVGDDLALPDAVLGRTVGALEP
jgi:hypothetical protein